MIINKNDKEWYLNDGLWNYSSLMVAFMMVTNG